MSGINEALWEFPCEHNLKVMGLAEAPMQDIVAEIVLKHVENFDRSRMTIKESKTGKYHSVTAIVMLQNKEQVEGIYRDLAAHEDVAWTL